MILYQIRLTCKGCYQPLPLHQGIGVSDPENLPRLLQTVRRLALAHGWTEDWCPKCTIQRQAAG